MDMSEKLQLASDHIFSTGLNDSGTRLGLANMTYGLAKIHWVQEQMGLSANATFISAPDLSVTRNENRWRSGFGYGGSVTWGDGSLDLMILDAKPNACGMLVGGLDYLPDSQELLRRIHALTLETVEIDGIQIQWDFGKSNHFIDLFRCEALAETTFPPYIFIMHFAGGELRRDSIHGPGLYWDQSVILQTSMQVFDTPFGPLRVLTGDGARQYFQTYCQVDSFVKKRRIYASQRLFGEYQLINNDNHQCMSHANQVLLGCYRFTDSECVYPIALRADLPAYLVRGKPSLSPESIERLGFEKRAQRLGVHDWLSTANILPHGGGYTFPHILGVADVHVIDGERYFEVDFTTAPGRQIFSSVRDLPYEYRGQKVIMQALELGMAELVARLIPVYILKI